MLKKLKYIKLIMLILICGLTILSPIIIKLWIGDKINVSTILIINFAIYAFLMVVSGGYAVIFNGLGKLEAQLKIAIVQGIINIPLSIYFAKYLGLGTSGVILGTNLTLMLAVLIFPIEMQKILNEIDLEKTEVK